MRTPSPISLMATEPITLKLSNFRCHLDRTFELSPRDTGIVLIQGVSGRGKSTIADAITFALFGTTAVRKVKSFGKRTTKVTLVWPQVITINRSQAPNRLEVTLPDYPTVEGEPAQACIQEVFGEWSEFQMGGYLRQKTANSFFSMSPAEQWKLISRLTFDDIDITKLKQKVQDEIKLTERNLVEAESAFSVINGQYLEAKRSFDTTYRDMSRFNTTSYASKEITEDSSDSDLSEVIESLTRQRDTLNEYQVMIEKYKFWSEQLTTYRSKLTQMKSEVSCRESEEMTAKEELVAASKVSDEAVQFIKVYTILNQTRSELLRRNTDMTAYQQRLADHQKVLSEYPDNITEFINTQDQMITLWDQYLVSINPLLDFKGARELRSILKDFTEWSYTELAAYISKVEKLLAETQAELDRYNNYKEPLICPSCSTGLVLESGSLHLHDQAEPPSISDSAASLKILKHGRKVLQLLNSAVLSADKLKDYSPEDLEEILEDDELEKLRVSHREVGYLQGRISALEGQEKTEWTPDEQDELNKVNCNVQPNDLLLDHVWNELVERYQQSTSAMLHYKAIREKVERSSVAVRRARDELLKVTSTVRDLEKSMGAHKSLMNKSIEQLETLMEKTLSEQRDIDYYIKWLTAYRDMMSRKRLSDQEKVKVESARHSAAVAPLLKKHMIDVERECLADRVSVINTMINSYLEDMFDDPLSMRITLASADLGEDSKGRKKTKTTMTGLSSVKTELVYHGEVIPFSALSGGEQDRVSLAMTLAMAELSSSNLLILDECLSSLDSATCDDILFKLQERVADTSLVFVISHQANTGLFDSVVEV